MDVNGSSRYRQRKATPSGERFLGAYPHAATSRTPEEETELNEDEIFSAAGFPSDENNHRLRRRNTTTGISAISPAVHRHNLNHNQAFPESFGILAALPDHNNHHYVYQKTVTTAASAASSRLILTIPKPPLERAQTSAASSTSSKSAPVNVPILSAAMRRTRHKDFDEIGEDDEVEGDEEMMPPHEIVAREQSPMLSCSVLEGVGRTLKGRDLRQQFRSGVELWGHDGDKSEAEVELRNVYGSLVSTLC